MKSNCVFIQREFLKQIFSKFKTNMSVLYLSYQFFLSLKTVISTSSFKSDFFFNLKTSLREHLKLNYGDHIVSPIFCITTGVTAGKLHRV